MGHIACRGGLFIAMGGSTGVVVVVDAWEWVDHGFNNGGVVLFA
jgi:hypothetical protein